MPNSDLKHVITGPVAVYIGATKIPNIQDKDVSLTFEGKRIEYKSNAFGDAIRKLILAGVNGTLNLTFSAEQKPLLARMYNWIESTGINPADPFAGQLLLKSKNGVCIKPYTITLYLQFKDCDTGIVYGADASNPVSFQIPYAFSPTMIEWLMNTDDVISHEAEFTIGVDEDNDSLMLTVGSNTLPLAGVVFLNVTPGSYTLAPSATVGTQFGATTPYTLNQQVAHLGNLYTVTTAGTTGAIGTAPVHVAGTAVSGTVTFTFTGKAATLNTSLFGTALTATINQNGFGYTSAPAVVLSGGTGSGGVITTFLG